jgi:squalene synthase HpnD
LNEQNRGTSHPPPTSEEFTAAHRHVRAVVARSGSSFTMGMRILPPARREAMYAIYAFCREVDDIADEGGTREEKLAGLEGWRRRIDDLYEGRSANLTTLALLEPVSRYDLPKAEFLAVIDGMEMDAKGPIVAPDWKTLRLYCRRVAGAVGMLSMPVFGAPQGEASEKFALALGEALQLTNILRDVQEDAAIGRLYLPHEALTEHGVPVDDVAAALAHPNLPLVCRDVAAEARARFAEARALLPAFDWRVLRPALAMRAVYERLLDRLEARDFPVNGGKMNLSRAEKIIVGARAVLLPPRGV